MNLIKTFKDNMLTQSYKDVLKIAFDDYEYIPVEDTSVLSYKSAAIKTLEDNNKSSQIYSLKNATSFTNSELDDFHDRFHSLVIVNSTVAVIDEFGFQTLLTQIAPPTLFQWLRANSEAENLLWNKIRFSEEDNQVDFEGFVSFLSKILKDSLENRFEFFMELFDVDNDSELSKSEILKVVEGIISAYEKTEVKARIESFVEMIFDTVIDTNCSSTGNYDEENMYSSRIAFGILRREMLQKYKLNGMFRLESTPNSLVERNHSKTIS